MDQVEPRGLALGVSSVVPPSSGCVLGRSTPAFLGLERLFVFGAARTQRPFELPSEPLGLPIRQGRIPAGSGSLGLLAMA